MNGMFYKITFNSLNAKKMLIHLFAMCEDGCEYICFHIFEEFLINFQDEDETNNANTNILKSLKFVYETVSLESVVDIHTYEDYLFDIKDVIVYLDYLDEMNNMHNISIFWNKKIMILSNYLLTTRIDTIF
jgi:predicted transcriptional regulator